MCIRDRLTDDDLDLEPKETSLICDLPGSDDDVEEEPNNSGVLPEGTLGIPSIEVTEEDDKGAINPVTGTKRNKENYRDPGTKDNNILRSNKKLNFKLADTVHRSKTFLCSLSMLNLENENQCHPDAVKYIKQYSRNKEELARR